MTFSFRSLAFGLGLLVFLGLPLSALAQTDPLSSRTQAYVLDSGVHENTRAATTVEAYRATVEVPGAPWLRLAFDEVALGKESYLTVTSLQDGAEQRLDAEALAAWRNTSAYFNGDAVEVRLFVVSGDENVSVRMGEVVVGETPTTDRSQCDATDDRVASSDPRAGRLLPVGCTAWLIENGDFISAGHCFALGDGDVVQFNVPPSLPDGTIQNPPPEDQYPVNQGSLVSAFGGIGNDWAVFATAANAQTGLTALDAQGGFFNLVRDLSPATIRITGYGVDDSPPGSTGGRNAQNQTQQTNAGPNAGSTGTTLRYRADTEGGNSGSPVIDDATGNALGVHTNGGCFTSGGGSNSGTSFFNASFWDEVDGVEPVAVFDPDPSLGVETTLAEGQSGTVSFSLRNDGNEDLTYDFLQFARGLGGPDAFGYAWIDSNEPDGPVFDFVDISTTGTALDLSDDDGEFVSLPFAFPFYGDGKTQIGISSNGYLTFDPSDSTPSSLSNQSIPTSGTPNDLIAVYWDDLDPGGAVGEVYYRDLGDGRFVVQWDDIPHFPDGEGEISTFQAILSSDGTILLQYLSFTDDASGPNGGTVGIENGDGSFGLEVAHNEPYVEDGLAVLIRQVPGFITGVAPAAGTLIPGESATITVSVSADDLAPDTYLNSLIVTTNEPATYNYPVRLNVTSSGALAVTAEAVNPPVVLGPPGGSFGYTVTLTNGAATAQTFDAWVDVILPNGNPFGPVEGPRTVTLQAGQTVGPVALTANVPAVAPAGTYTARVRVGDFPGTVEAEGTFTFQKTGAARGTLTAVDWPAGAALNILADAAEVPAAASTATPDAVTLEAAYPNPFDRSATLGFALPSSATVRVAVYDVLGRTVDVLVDGEVEAGRHTVGFDADGLAGGVYLVRLEVGGQVQTQRITLLK